MKNEKTLLDKMLAANKARTEILADNPEINSKWTPNAIKIIEDKKKEEFMECVYKKELGPDFEAMEDGVAMGLIDFTQDSEYKRLYESKSD